MTEAELTAAVIDLAHALGWKAVHWRPALTGRGWRTAVQGDGVGWPDMTFVRSGRMLVAELKQDGKHPTGAQMAWLALLRSVPGVEAYTWHPAQWHDRTIERVLRLSPEAVPGA